MRETKSNTKQNTMKNILISVFMIILGLAQATGQSLSSSVVSTAGGFYDQTGSSLSVTAGEPLIAFHSTDNHSLSAGFQQSYGALLRALLVNILLEGPYNGTAMAVALNNDDLLPLNQPFNINPWFYTGSESVTNFPATVVDWLLVELRDADAPQNADETTTLAGWPKALLLDDEGNILDLDGNPEQFVNTAQDNLYIVVRHRNHLDVMSSEPLVLSGNTYIYDFTDAITKAYGSAMGYKQIASGVFGMVAGDSDADGAIFTSDYNRWAAVFGNTLIYLAADLDMDGQVFASDFNKWAINFGTNPSNTVICPFKSQVPKKIIIP
jgi:hypothetical protein